MSNGRRSSRVGQVHLAGWNIGRRVGLGRATELAFVVQPAMLAKVLVGLVATAFGVQLVLKEAGAEPQPLSPRTRDRLRVLPAFGL